MRTGNAVRVRRGRGGLSARRAVLSLALVVAFVGAACGGSGDSGSGDDPGTVLRVRHAAVTVATGDDDPAPATDGRALSVGDTVRTDASGQADVDYADGSQTRLGADTELTLVELAEASGPRVTVVQLDGGRTFHRVADLTESGERFEVRTASLTAAVVGTVFGVLCVDPKPCSVWVLEGEVEVTLADGTSRSIGPRERLRLGDDGAPEVDSLSDADLAADAFIRENMGRDGVDLPVPTTTTTTTAPTAPTGAAQGTLRHRQDDRFDTDLAISVDSQVVVPGGDLVVDVRYHAQGPRWIKSSTTGEWAVTCGVVPTVNNDLGAPTARLFLQPLDEFADAPAALAGELQPASVEVTGLDVEVVQPRTFTFPGDCDIANDGEVRLRATVPEVAPGEYWVNPENLYATIQWSDVNPPVVGFTFVGGSFPTIVVRPPG